MNNFFLLIPIALLLFSCGNNDAPKEVIDPKISVVLENTGPLFSFEDNNGTGFKNINGKVVIPPIFEHSYTDTFNKGIAFVIDSTGALIGIDRQGKKLLTPYFFDNGPDYISEGLFRFVENKKMGFADADGKIIIPAKYEFVSAFEGGMACFGNGFTLKKDGENSLIEGGKWGLIDIKGDTSFEQKYSAMPEFVNGNWQVKEKGEKSAQVLLHCDSSSK